MRKARTHPPVDTSKGKAAAEVVETEVGALYKWDAISYLNPGPENCRVTKYAYFHPPLTPLFRSSCLPLYPLIHTVLATFCVVYIQQ